MQTLESSDEMVIKNHILTHIEREDETLTQKAKTIDEKQSRSPWRVVRISTLLKGGDGNVHNAKVTTISDGDGKSILRQSVNKYILLGLAERFNNYSNQP